MFEIICFDTGMMVVVKFEAHQVCFNIEIHLLDRGNVLNSFYMDLAEDFL